MPTDYFLIILLSTIMSAGDIIKYIVEGNYIYKNTISSSYELLLYIFHIIIFTLIVILRIIYIQIEYDYFNYFNKQKIIKWLVILFCKEIVNIILLIIYTDIFNQNWIGIGILCSSVINSIYVRIYFKEYFIQHLRVSPNLLLTTISIIPNQHNDNSIIPTNYIINQHLCKENCDICPCIICSESIDNFVELKCKHKFHHNCLIKWLSQKKTTCPLCRSEL